MTLRHGATKMRTFLPFMILLLGVASLHGCASKFNDCSATRTCPSPARGGNNEGGAAGATEEHAGAGGTGAEAGGAGGSDSGAGGEGGDGVPLIDAPCSENGALACQGPAQRLALLCRKGAWVPNVTCAVDENCDQPTGACAKIVPACRERAPGEVFCDGDTLVECGMDLVSSTETPCDGVCSTTESVAACQEPTCSDNKVEAPEGCDDGNTESGDGCSSECTWEVRSIVAGGSHTCALSEGGTVKCWGANASGQLGLGDARARGDEPKELGAALPAVDLGKGRSAKQIFAGGYGTCALLDDDSLKCWGENSYGQLGLGDTENRGDQPKEMGEALPSVDLGAGRTARSVAVGWNSICALLDNGAVKCWGDNKNGQLGLGDTVRRGALPDEMGNALPAVDLGGGHSAKSVSVGYTHACAVLDDDGIKCWGDNKSGQLGLGDTIARGVNPGELGSNLPEVDLNGRTALSIGVSTGDSYYMDPIGHSPFSCAALSDGSLGCWGWLKHLGFSPITVGDQPMELGAALPLLSLGTRRSVQMFDVGIAHVCAILDDRSLKCWGNNDYGQVGPNPTVENPSPIDLGKGQVPIGLTLGANHGCVLLRDRSVKCWGNNLSGQLGLGDVVNRGLNEGELGDALPSVDLSF
jgi:cysteine-rich repeat protein